MNIFERLQNQWRTPGLTGSTGRLPSLVQALALVLGLSAAALTPCSSLASVPTTATIDGVLNAAAGGPASDGKYAIKVGLYKDGSTPAALWTESANIDVKGGRFSYVLGSTTPVSAASLASASYFGIAVGTDPEATRRPLHTALFAQRAAVTESLGCSGCLTTANLDAALQGQVSTIASRAKVSDSGLYSDLTGAPDVSGLLKKADLKTVATTGSFKDLSDAPVAPVLGKTCGTGLVLAGFKADGSLDCVAGGSSGLAKDGISKVSNGLFLNTFIDKTSGKTDIMIPDGLGAGVTDTLTFPSIGTCQKIWIELNLTNSDISGIKIELYGPSMLNPYVLYQGGKTGTSITASYNVDTPLVTGDMSGDWVGKDIAGTWSITVKDLKAGGGSGGFDGKVNWAVAIQTLSSQKVNIKGDLIVDGNLTVLGNNGMVPQVFWSGAWQTMSNGADWYCGNNAQCYAGINPNGWTDGNAVASSIGNDLNLIKNLFGFRRAISANANVCSETWDNYSSSTGRVCGAVFRVNNPTNADITWPISFYYTAYSGWGEQASVSINGANNWQSNNDSWPNAAATVNVAVPKGRISTVIVISPSSPQFGNSQRNNFLAFYSNSLKLPAGLSYVDDLESATGAWK